MTPGSPSQRDLRAGLAAWNALPGNEARETLVRCCGSSRWVDAMLAARPFPDLESLARATEARFDALSRADWLEAFAAHPRIGDLESLRERFRETADLAEEEQAGSAQASEAVLRELAEGNQRYEERFGHIFIVFASGKSADTMLSMLRERSSNSPAEELVIASNEQRKITRLRLENTLKEFRENT